MVKIFFPLIILLFVICSPLAADILILNNDMILSGEIIEDKHPEYIKFANYHGVSIVNYNLIKEIHRTEGSKEDVEILSKLGLNVYEEDVKLNYQTGARELNEHVNAVKVEDDEIRGIYAGLDFFYSRNYGDIKSEIPSGMGLFASVKFSAGLIQPAEILKISGIECGAGYLYSAEGRKSIESLFFSAGPVWNFGHSVRGFDFNWSLSGLMGLGYYSVKNGEEESGGVKWNMTILAGPEYKFSAVTVAPRFRFDYIYDSYAPLISMGISLGFGRIF